MFYVEDEFMHEIEIKRSKFIAYLIPVTSFENTLQRLKEEHPKARHFVSAFTRINTYDQLEQGSSDDGEPKGTSGKPTLAVLNGEQLVNCAIITVRYFGGIKLGTGGLVRAYAESAKEVIAHAELLLYEKKRTETFRTTYSQLGKTEYQLEQNSIEIIHKEFLAECVELTLSATDDNFLKFHAAQSERG